MRRRIQFHFFRMIFLLLITVLGCITLNPLFAETTLLFPQQVTSQRGKHSDKDINILSTLEQSGQADDSATYIHFHSRRGKYNGEFVFALPNDIQPSDVEAVKLMLNYRGPDRQTQRWRWRIWDTDKKSWVAAGDNKEAANSVWSNLEFAVGGTMSRYINNDGTIRVRYSSSRARNVAGSELDYFALSVDHDDASVTPPPPSHGAIWQPTPGTSWQWQLTGQIDTSIDVQMYDIDLFDVSKDVVNRLHSQGRTVICYFSAGSWENWRPDAKKYPASVQGRSNGWPGEKWLDIRKIDELSPIFQARLDLAVEKGCDGVEPDNIDGYSNKTGFPLTYNDQLKFNKWLAKEAHQRGLSIGLKNDLDQVDDLVDHFDWAINEQCFQYNECDLLLPFIRAGKAVFNVEYDKKAQSFCPKANAMGFSSLQKKLNLDAWLIDCLKY